MTDFVTSVGVVAGRGLATATGWLLLDPLMAAFVAANILCEGWHVVTSSLSGLMDRVIEPAEKDRVRANISAHADGALEVDDLKRASPAPPSSSSSTWSSPKP